MTEHDRGLRGRLATDRARAAYRSHVGPGRRLIAVSDSLAATIAEASGLDRSRIDVIPNAVDVASFRRAEPDRREPGLLLWVGARQDDKGTPLLLRAFALARSDRPELRLRLVGRPRELGRRGAVPRPRRRRSGSRDPWPSTPPSIAPALPRPWRLADLFVHPSPFETFGVVVAEALAAGLPAVMTPSGAEAVLGGDRALGEVARARARSPRGGDRSCARAPNRIRSGPPRAAVETEFARPVVTTRIVELYGSLLADRPAAAADVTPGPDGADPLTGLPTIVGFRRTSVARRLGEVPPGLAEQLIVVTTAGQEPLPRVGAAVEADVAADWQRHVGGRAARCALCRPGAESPALSCGRVVP